MLRFLTFNVHSIEEVKGVSKSWQERFEILVEKLAAEKYDIIAFQEINQGLSTRYLTEIELRDVGFFTANNGQEIREDNVAFQLAQALKSKGLNYSWNYNMCHIGYNKYEEGTAIFTLRKVRGAKAFVCSDDSVKGTWRYRVQTGMKIQGENEIFWCISSHFSWWKHAESPLDDFQHEWDYFKKVVKPFSDKTIIAIGDFNNSPQISNQGYDYVTKECKWYDMFLKDGTSEPENLITVMDVNDSLMNEFSKGRRLDYAVSNKNLYFSETKISFDGKNGEIISDHFAVEGAIDL